MTTAPSPEAAAPAVGRLRRQIERRGVAICVCGVDGSGKTTLAERLRSEFSAAGLPVRYLHAYQSYRNLLVTPWVLLHNRYVAHRVLVFDRTIFDNLAVACANSRLPRRLLRAAVTITQWIYPRFDRRFHLVATLAETLQRRPDTIPSRYHELLGIYRDIASAAGFVELPSDEALVGRVLERL